MERLPVRKWIVHVDGGHELEQAARLCHASCNTCQQVLGPIGPTGVLCTLAVALLEATQVEKSSTFMVLLRTFGLTVVLRFGAILMDHTTRCLCVARKASL